MCVAVLDMAMHQNFQSHTNVVKRFFRKGNFVETPCWPNFGRRIGFLFNSTQTIDIF